MSELSINELLTIENEKLKEIIKSLDKSAQMLLLRDVELREANTKLTTLDKQKSEFIAIAAHQLRTPLTSIKFAHQILSDSISEKLSEDNLKVLESARLSIDRMFTMIEDLLVIDAIDYGDLQLAHESFSIEKCIEDILSSFTEIIHNKQLQIRKNFMENPPKVSCDSHKIRDVLSNIIDNAIKYTPSKGEISISTMYTQDNLIVNIDDTGIGVEQRDEHLLFKKFSRMDNAKLLDANGSGLGLYIARKIIEKHLGSITFLNRLPQGSSFIISLPL